MPRGEKTKYTHKQKRQAEHIEKGYEKRGMSKTESRRRAWATVNKVHKGGEKPGGGGFGKPEDRSPMRKGGKRGGSVSRRPASARSASGRKAARTRKTGSRRQSPLYQRKVLR